MISLISNCKSNFVLIVFVYLILSGFFILAAQRTNREYLDTSKYFIVNLENAPYPHSSRGKGYKYNNKFYNLQDHYNDSRVAFYTPRGYNQKKNVDILVHFHGWYAELSDIMERDRLAEQVSISRKNVILIVPQGPKNAPDSVYGKLETKNGFKNFIKESLTLLKNKGYTTSTRPGRIVISGHSGAYHVISLIVTRGGLIENISEVYLFDALYGELEKFVYWFDNYNVKFINLYIKPGATYERVKTILEDLSDWDYPYIDIYYHQLSKKIIKRNHIIFISSSADHNEIVHKNNPLARLLNASRLKTIKR